MRFLIQAKIPTQAGNLMLQDPNLLRKLQTYINKAKAEATYFFEEEGNRVAVFIVDVPRASEIPVLVEPLFSGMGARVELHPVMSFDDLKKGYLKPWSKQTLTASKDNLFLILGFLFVTKNITEIEVVEP